MKKFFQNNKKRLVIIVAISFLFTASLFILSPRNKQQLQKTEGPSNFPVVNGELKLISVSPPPPVIVSVWTIEPIFLRFNQEIQDINSIKYEVAPDTKTRLELSKTDPTVFKILPLEGWSENVEYTIKIKAGDLKAKNGLVLKEDINISFKRVQPDESKIQKLDQDFVEVYF